MSIGQRYFISWRRTERGSWPCSTLIWHTCTRLAAGLKYWTPLMLCISMITTHVTIVSMPPEWRTVRLWYTLKSVALETEELPIFVFAFRTTERLDFVCHLVFKISQKKTWYLWKLIFFCPQVKRWGWKPYPVCPIRRRIFVQIILFVEPDLHYISLFSKLPRHTLR